MPPLPAGLDPLAPALGLAGLIWGLAADRIAARWPAHEDGAVRKVDWRTPVVAVFAAVALAALPLRFGDPGQRLLFGVFFAAWALAMATDLDQRLIPDVITLSPGCTSTSMTATSLKSPRSGTKMSFEANAIPLKLSC